MVKGKTERPNGKNEPFVMLLKMNKNFVMNLL